MLRNREVITFFCMLMGISMIGMVIATFISIPTLILVSVISFVLIGITWWITRWRYREIQKLSGYLREIASGNFTLDVRDNTEGELSILKNEIYKVNTMLSENSSLLQQDKIGLTNAISDISHQLKTPLTSMRVMTDLLEDPHLPPNKRLEFIRNVNIQLDRLEWLVTSLLKLSKIDAGTIQFKQQVVNIHKLVEKALEPVRIPIDIKDQNVIMNGNDTATVMVDMNWTVEALVNILKNCVEHTPLKGEIIVSFTENTLFSEIIIADNGKGIPREDLPFIFKRFYKGKSASEDSVGIGLAMAHTIITNQNGRIEVNSEQGKGTQFRIVFYKQTI